MEGWKPVFIGRNGHVRGAWPSLAKTYANLKGETWSIGDFYSPQPQKGQEFPFSGSFVPSDDESMRDQGGNQAADNTGGNIPKNLDKWISVVHGVLEAIGCGVVGGVIAVVLLRIENYMVDYLLEFKKWLAYRRCIRQRDHPSRQENMSVSPPHGQSSQISRPPSGHNPAMPVKWKK
jgi:hypothetical protein